jgi:DNA replication and repair protein RecF
MVYVQQLWLQNFRNYAEVNLSISSGQILLIGDNGQGKSNFLEAIGYLSTGKSFRGIPTEALIKQDCDNAIIRAEVSHTGRELLVEVEISRARQNKIFINKQKISPIRNLTGMIPATIFGPDDLTLVKNGPSVRRTYLDDLLVQLHPKNIQIRADLEQVLKQRNALLKQAHGRLTEDIASTLQVWNEKFHYLSHEWGKARQTTINAINSFAADAYMELAGSCTPLKLIYDPEWLECGLLEALKLQEKDELRRGTSLVGPHRDEITIMLSGLPARTHASQGEQRTIALSLRIAGHELLKETHNTNPLLLLDDVFSELDIKRAKRLLKLLVADQTFISTAIAPEEISGSTQIHIDGGKIL